MKKNTSLLYDKKIAEEFLIQSNMIEGVNIKYAHEDAIKAWKYAAKLTRMTESDVLEIHKILMKRFNPRIAGKYRTCEVWIGGQKKGYWGEAILSGELVKVLAFIEGTLVSIVRGQAEDLAQGAHVMFEDIHPFEDGNGRVGRIIYNWHRLQLGLPLHVIHVGQEQFEYYDWFKQNGKR